VSPQLLENGSLVIPQRSDETVRFYAPDGTLQATMGRRGDGPGEFRMLGEVWSVGDTVEALDWSLGRITRIVSADSIEIVTLRPRGSAEAAVGRVDEGWMLFGLLSAGGREGVGVESRDTVGYRRFARDGSDLGEVVRLAGLSRVATENGRAIPHPLSPDTRAATHQGRLFVGETQEPVIRVFDSTGVVEREIRWEAEDRDPAAAQSEVLGLVTGRRDRNPNMPEMDYSDVPVAERLSAFWGLLVDELGFVWVLPYDAPRHAHAMGGWRGPGPGGRWMVFTQDGRRVADVEMPARLYPSQITRDAVVGVERDELGVESVAVFPLHRR
jgi:hypothetical protein